MTDKSRVDLLSEKVAALSSKVNSKEKCFPTRSVIAISAPILAWVVLYLLQPSFVQKQEGKKFVRDNKKTALYALGISVVVWVCLFLFTYCYGARESKMCLE